MLSKISGTVALFGIVLIGYFGFNGLPLTDVTIAILAITIVNIICFYFSFWIPRMINSYTKSKEDSLKNQYEMELAKAKVYSDSILDSVSSSINTFGKDYIMATKVLNTSLQDHLNTLNQLIDTEFHNMIILPRSGMKDKPPIEDIKAITDEIANRVFTSLKPEFFRIFESHGISEEFIMSYMTRQIFAKEIEYIRAIRKKE